MPESATKVFVITNARGQIVGSSVAPAGQRSAGAPSPGRPVPLRGQKVHEVELPAELRRVESTEELHKQLKRLIAKRGKGKPKKRTAD